MISSTINWFKLAKNRKKSASEKPENEEVYHETSQRVEISFSDDDQYNRNLPSIPHGSNMFTIKERDNQDKFEEDKMENFQSLNRLMM